MNKSYETKHIFAQLPPVIVFLLSVPFLVVGIFLLVASIWLALLTITTGEGGVLPIALAVFFFALDVFICVSGIFILRFGLACISIGLAVYRIDSDGLHAQYPFTAPELYHWEEFQQVCICYDLHYTAYQPRALKVICFVKKGTKKNLYGRWPTENPLKYRSVIVFEYTDELYEAVKEICPLQVADIRNPWEIKRYEKAE